MTIRFQPETYQDTVSNRSDVIQDTLRSGPESNSLSDSTSSISDTIQESISGNVNNRHDTFRSDSAVLNNNSSATGAFISKSSPVFQQADSLSINTQYLCMRNAIADITYYNPDYIITSIGSSGTIAFPFLFTEKNRQIHSDKRASVEKHLKTGLSLPQKLFHEDWAIGIILMTIILFSVTRATSRSIVPAITRFFLFRGTKEESSRNISGIFQWQSTVLNLSSFSIIGLFVYFAADYYTLIPREIPGVAVWLISVGTIIIAVTLRHLVCVGTGTLSGQEEVFRDYLHTVYQSYRFNALIVFILIIMMSYTSFFSGKSYFITGGIFFSFLYLIRIFRLFIIFINRNISIFYLILYLCALEILPVLIIFKYLSGLT